MARSLHSGMILPMKKSWLPLLSSVISLGLCVACLPSASPVTALPPAPTPTVITLYATHTTSVAPPTSEVALLQTSTPPSQDCPSDTTHAAIQYDIEAAFDYTAHRVTVIQHTTFTNTLDAALDAIVFHVPPNRQSGLFTLESITLAASTPSQAPAALEGVRLVVPLTNTLLPGCSQEIRLAYSLDLPLIGSRPFPRHGFLGYSETQVNLGLWLPVIAHYQAGEWLTPPLVNIGEQTVLPAADYRVQLYVRNAPANLVVVGPGEQRQQGQTWEFTLRQARDIVLTMSADYHALTSTTRDGVTVELYTLTDTQPDDGTANAPAHALATATQALELYTGLYGPYPYQRLVVVESVFPDGMEFSGLVFVGGEWFSSYTGDPASYLTLITAHEVTHQWWYLQVGNDQGREPWLDEALCTYNEYVFLQENYPALADWWWGFRVDGFDPAGYIDRTVYEFDDRRTYINATYLQGARMMHAIRQEIGTEAFFDWLQAYAADMNGQIATAADLWAQLPPDALETTRSIRARYLRQPGP